MMGPYLPECPPCSQLGQHAKKLHCVHFGGKVVHWWEAEGGGPHFICGPDNAVQAHNGVVLHTAGEAAFNIFAEAEAEFGRRTEILRTGA